MTTAEFQKRKKIVKTIGLSLVATGIVVPIIFANKGNKIISAVLGSFIGLILFGAIASAGLPDPDTKLTT